MTFKSQIAAFNKKVTVRSEDEVRGLSLSIFSKVVMRTPVDTGRARGNWQYSFSKPTGTLTDTGANTAINKAKATSAGFKAGKVIWIINNLPYIQRLEDGDWSTQAPQGMVKVTLAAFKV